MRIICENLVDSEEKKDVKQTYSSNYNNRCEVNRGCTF